MFSFFYKHFLDKKNATPRFLATIVNLPNNAWVQNNLENFWHNSEPIHQHPTLFKNHDQTCNTTGPRNTTGGCVPNRFQTHLNTIRSPSDLWTSHLPGLLLHLWRKICKSLSLLLHLCLENCEDEALPHCECLGSILIVMAYDPLPFKHPTAPGTPTC